MSKENNIIMPDNGIAKEVLPLSVKDFLHETYLPFAHYVITDRALTAEDGLKPVQRRLLWTMWYLNLKNSAKTVKAATVYGNTAAYFHPHGPTSVSGAGAYLAQKFNTRVPLIDVQGSVGFNYGDSPAADRYYEIRLTKAGEELLADTDNHASVMIPNYDNSKEIPSQLPVRWPYNIICGSEGIAVGYASKTYAHNPDEVINACIARLKGEIDTPEDVLKYIKGPDLPTGGVLIGIDGVKDYITTGKGSFIIRGQYSIEPMERGRNRIIFYEMPYQESAEKLITSIRKHQKLGKLTEIHEVKDLSDAKSGLKISIVTKAGANPNLVLEDLWALTPCQSRLSVNQTILVDGSPQVVSMLEMIDIFLSFRMDCYTRSKQYRLGQIEKEKVRQEGLMKISLNVDKAIEIIKEADDSEQARINLSKEFAITEEQADYVLQMRLKSLTKADSKEIADKLENLLNEEDELKKVLESAELKNEKIIEELEKVLKIISDKRRTVIMQITSEDLKNQEKNMKKMEKQLSKDVECRVVMLDDKTITKELCTTENNNRPYLSEAKTTSLSDLYLLAKDGRVTKHPISTIPLNTLTDIRSLGVDSENLACLFDSSKRGILVVTNQGRVNITRSAKIKENADLVSLNDNEKIVYAVEIDDKEYESCNLAILADTGMLAHFPLNLVRESGQGSGLISGMNGNVVSATLTNQDEVLLTLSANSELKLTEVNEIPVTGRGVKGSSLHKAKTKGDTMTYAFSCKLDNLAVLDKKGKEIVLPEITGRATRGKILLEKPIIRQVKKEIE